MKTKPNNSDWQERFEIETSSYERQSGKKVTPAYYSICLDFISSELQREREKTLEEVEWIIVNLDTGEGELFNKTIRHELLSKLNNLREK